MSAALPIHPAADLFPMLPASELQALADDIKANGQREPVVIWEGSVLDGRNRLAACRIAGVEPLTRTLDACPDPLAFVLSLNLTRRHLDESQRAMVAAKVRPMLAEQARARQVAHLKQGETQPPPVSPDLGQRDGKSADQAADMLNVGRGTVEAAAKVLKRGVPELVTAVETKSVAVSAAAVLVSLPEDEQREVIAAGPDAIKAKVKAIRESRPKREPKGNAAPAPTKTVGQVAEEKIRAATTLDELDTAYQEASKANLTDREFEEIAEARQERGAELRKQAQATAPAPVEAPPPQPEKAVPVEPAQSDELAALRAEVERLRTDNALLSASVEGYQEWVALIRQRINKAPETIKGTVNLDRVRKLVELAGSPSENEARNAAMLACRHIREQRIRMVSDNPLHSSDPMEKALRELHDAMRDAGFSP